MSEELRTTLGAIWILAAALSVAAAGVNAPQAIGFLVVLALGGSLGAMIGSSMGSVGWGVVTGLVLAFIASVVWLAWHLRPVEKT